DRTARAIAVAKVSRRVPGLGSAAVPAVLFKAIHLRAWRRGGAGTVDHSKPQHRRIWGPPSFPLFADPSAPATSEAGPNPASLRCPACFGRRFKTGEVWQPHAG